MARTSDYSSLAFIDEDGRSRIFPNAPRSALNGLSKWAGLSENLTSLAMPMTIHWHHIDIKFFRSLRRLDSLTLVLDAVDHFLGATNVLKDADTLEMWSCPVLNTIKLTIFDPFDMISARESVSPSRVKARLVTAFLQIVLGFSSSHMLHRLLLDGVKLVPSDVERGEFLNDVVHEIVLSHV
ncbi:hypothetical protein EXIGLDRAFT_766837 [Exidia glandulosa HHB12029]|uniref:Uncharacterized protein n=1 Tax=Exidia glandulosa HHB12029 TaxID=1314781 RepID=A0A165JGL2_EXIGL|nr:hypothetical protein EXIGLDRAFT_766837 [Exidia glandulosa HHB12029]